MLCLVWPHYNTSIRHNTDNSKGIPVLPISLSDRIVSILYHQLKLFFQALFQNYDSSKVPFSFMNHMQKVRPRIPTVFRGGEGTISLACLGGGRSPRSCSWDGTPVWLVSWSRVADWCCAPSRLACPAGVPVVLARFLVSGRWERLEKISSFFRTRWRVRLPYRSGWSCPWRAGSSVGARVEGVIDASSWIYQEGS